MGKIRKLAYAVTHKDARRALLSARVVPSLELRALLAALRPHTVVDVGANAGQFTLLALLELRASHVIAFEPLPSAAHRFRLALRGNRRVTLHEFAIGANSCKADLHVSAKDDSSSMLPIGKGQIAAFPGTHQAATQRVRVAPLTEFVSAGGIPRLSLLKIDVQGYEIEALKGCESVLQRFGHVLIEASFDELYEGQPLARDVIAWMAARGFVLVRAMTSNARTTRVPVQGDFLFCPT